MKQVKRNSNVGVEIFTQHAECEARILFEDGHTISVMTADRDPTSSLTA